MREEEILRKVQEQVEGIFKWEKDNERRKLNLVIFNLVESENRYALKRVEHDRKACEELFEEGIWVDDYKIEKIDRLGRKTTGKERPILVRVRSEEERWKILRRNTELRKI